MGRRPRPPPSLQPGLADARRRYPTVAVAPSIVAALVETASALGIGSMRAPLLALRAARAHAALWGRLAVEEADAALAARLVLAPRATRLPVADAAPDPPNEDSSVPSPDDAPPEQPPPQRPADESPADPATGTQDPTDLVLSAAKAAIPPGLLAQLQAASSTRSRGQTAGRTGPAQGSAKRGRPAGVRRGRPGNGVRLNVIETLRAAAPWQRIRGAMPGTLEAGRRIEIRRDDLRITRLKQRSETTTLFVVDASGSLAANRLAEAKGAVELLLAECYVRRDQVALLTFRGRQAELLLPPTRSLARAQALFGGTAGRWRHAARDGHRRGGRDRRPSPTARPNAADRLLDRRTSQCGARRLARQGPSRG